ncbi:MAG: UDP-N-acetylmuramoyl-tripeptide--D-alanyl-D-alanine ligase [Spirochaetia bacterium]|nr:UDP-N-acetylmuramoyl-tripeptide--D-alanyl-D-alanine ligase [Spirochaetota bacterium]MDW8112003.1 UDP-N-acetylmuramoyl-tripeptide--D-alanyl-D-alanine ligase [Spirochaetia bacterium]
MIEVSVSWLAKVSRGRLAYSKGPKLISGISTDSRNIKEGECFVALRGKNFDGHNFVKECLSKKVTTFVVEDAFFNSNTNLFESANAIVVKDTYRALMDIGSAYRNDFVPDKKIIAITGSSGKTTTKYIIAQLLSYKYKVEFSPKSYNNNVGVPLSILKINEDTDIGVLEVGMNRKGEIRKLSKIIMPDVGIITNIGYAHIEFLKTVRNIALAKSELFEGIRQGGVVFLNKNSRYLDVLEVNAKRFQLDIHYFDVKEARVIQNRGIDGVVFEYDDVEFDTSVPGTHNIENLVCAFEIAKFFGIKISDLVSIVKNLSLPEMRNNVIRGWFTVIDDSYNANPDSMMMALDLLDSAKSKGKKIAVLGDMLELGEHSQKLHLQVADHILNKNIDYILCYGENFSLVHDYLIEKGMDKNNVISTSSINEIADILGYLVKEGDIVLVKGSRGMRLNEIASFLENKMKENV